MNANLDPQSLPDSLAKLRQILQLLSALQSLPQPVTTPDGLHQAIADLVQLAGLLGIDSQWITRINQLLQDPTVFDVLLAIVRFALQLSNSGSSGPGPSRSPAGPTQAHSDQANALDLAAWLPIIEAIISFFQQMRGAK